MPLSLVYWPPFFSHSKSSFFPSVKSINKRQFMWRLRAWTLQPDFLGLNHEYEVGQIGHALRASISSFVRWEWYHHLHFTISWTDLVYTVNAQSIKSCYWFVLFCFPNVTTETHEILVLRLKKKKKAYDDTVNNLPIRLSKWNCTSWRVINFLSQISCKFLAYNKSSTNV